MKTTGKQVITRVLGLTYVYGHIHQQKKDLPRWEGKFNALDRHLEGKLNSLDRQVKLLLAGGTMVSVVYDLPSIQY